MWAVIYQDDSTPKLQQAWQRCLREETSGLILVMDNLGDQESVAKAQQELSLFVSFDSAGGEAEHICEQAIAVTSVPLLIFLCEANVVPPTTSPPLTPARVAHEFGLGDCMQNRKWCVRQVNPNTMQGIAEGLEWLVSNMGH